MPEIPTTMTAAKLRTLADWFDTYDALAERYINMVRSEVDHDLAEGALRASKSKSVQRDLRHWADELEGVVPPLNDLTRFCPYCGTRYELLPMTEPVIEATRDVPPPTRVTIYVKPVVQRMPDYNTDSIVHECRKGMPA